MRELPPRVAPPPFPWHSERPVLTQYCFTKLNVSGFILGLHLIKSLVTNL